MVMRRITPEKLAAALQKKPQVFADARGCAAYLPEVRARLVAASDRLAPLYPAEKFPPLTIAIARATPAGTANAKGPYIEMGRESCRERRRQTGLIWGVAVTINKKTTQ